MSRMVRPDVRNLLANEVNPAVAGLVTDLAVKLKS